VAQSFRSISGLADTITTGSRSVRRCPGGIGKAHPGPCDATSKNGWVPVVGDTFYTPAGASGGLTGLRQATRILFPSPAAFQGRPLTPLHSGHVTLCAVSGMLNGVFGSGKDLHVAAWQAVKVIDSNLYPVLCSLRPAEGCLPDPSARSAASLAAKTAQEA
jgi:hypothetical protein